MTTSNTSPDNTSALETPVDPPAATLADGAAVEEVRPGVPLPAIYASRGRARNVLNDELSSLDPNYGRILDSYNHLAETESLLRRHGYLDEERSMVSALRSRNRVGEADRLASLSTAQARSDIKLALRGVSIHDLQSNMTKEGILTNYPGMDEKLAGDLAMYRRGEMEQNNVNLHRMALVDDASKRTATDAGPLGAPAIVANMENASLSFESMQSITPRDFSATNVQTLAALQTKHSLTSDQAKSLTSMFVGGAELSEDSTATEKQDRRIAINRGMQAMHTLALEAGQEGIATALFLHGRQVTEGMSPEAIGAKAKALAPSLLVTREIPKALGLDQAARAEVSRNFENVLLLESGLLTADHEEYESAVADKQLYVDAVADFNKAAATGSDAEMVQWYLKHANSFGVTDEVIATRLGTKPHQVTLFKSGIKELETLAADKRMQTFSNYRKIDLKTLDTDGLSQELATALTTYKANQVAAPPESDADPAKLPANGDAMTTLLASRLTGGSGPANTTRARMLYDLVADPNQEFRSYATRFNVFGETEITKPSAETVKKYVGSGGLRGSGMPDPDKAPNYFLRIGGSAGDRAAVAASDVFATNLDYFKAVNDGSVHDKIMQFVASENTTIEASRGMTGARFMIKSKGAPPEQQKDIALPGGEVIKAGTKDADTRLKYAMFKESFPNNEVAKDYATFLQNYNAAGTVEDSRDNAMSNLSLSDAGVFEVNALAQTLANNMNRLATTLVPRDAGDIKVAQARRSEIRQQQLDAEIAIIQDEIKAAQSRKDATTSQVLSLLVKLVESEEGELTVEGLDSMAKDAVSGVSTISGMLSQEKEARVQALIKELNKKRRARIMGASSV